MTRHQKRLSAPTSWPVERKTHTFTVKAGAGPHGRAGVPLLILLRDVLGYVDSRREARYALDQDYVMVNGTPVSDPRRPIGMFDIVVFAEREEYYRVFPDEGGRLALSPIDADAAASKLGKIVGKTQVPGGGIQLALHDGETLLVDDPDAYHPGDSLVIDNDDGSIVAHFPYEEGALVTAVDGQHAGEIGRVEEIVVTPGSGSNIVRATTDDGAFETVAEYVVVIDENFVEGTAEPGDGETGDDAAGEPVDAEDEDDEAADDEEPVDAENEDEEPVGIDEDDAENEDEEAANEPDEGEPEADEE